jgi:lysine-specific demethylase 8
MAGDVQTAHVDLCSLLDYFGVAPEATVGASQPPRPRVYWAQHDLAEVPVMYADVVAPTMCGLTGRGGVAYRTNIWFCGSEGSYSPCHYDPYENLQCQVVGTKEVILFAPDFGHAHLYPAAGTVQSNTALVDVTAPDLRRYPAYAEGLHRIRQQSASEAAPQLLGARGVLERGDAVFIPRKWWHACVARDRSCSVNFWWV